MSELSTSSKIYTPKDLFSKQAESYAQYRPSYPIAMYDDMFSHTSRSKCAWDVATGNGQAAIPLTRKFKSVYANDISTEQLRNAKHKAGVYYFNCPAESTPFEDNLFDCITVAQSLHWLDQELFFAEMERVAKKGAILAIWSYSQPRVDEIIDNLTDSLYFRGLEKFWAPERKIVDNQYRAMLLPYQELLVKKYEHEFTWEREDYLGYLSSWSAVQTAKDITGEDPLREMSGRVLHYWKEEKQKQAQFNILLKLYRIK